MEQGDLRMETPGQRGKKRHAPLRSLTTPPERHQDMARVRFAHMHDPHDRQIGLDRTQQPMDGMLLQGRLRNVRLGAGIKDQIGVFRLNPFGQQVA